MSMTKCPECAKPVSEAAATCPHCGFPLAKAAPKPAAKGSPMLIGIALGAIILVGGVGYMLKQSQQEPASSQQATGASGTPEQTTQTGSQSAPAAPPSGNTHAAANSTSANQSGACVITPQAGGPIKLGMRIEEARKAFPAASFTRGTGTDGIPVVEVKVGGVVLMNLYADQKYETNTINEAGIIDTIQFYEPNCQTPEGLHAGMLLSETEKVWSKVAVIHRSEPEENLEFEKPLPGIKFHAHSAGVYQGESHETTQYNPEAKITSIWIEAPRTGN